MIYARSCWDQRPRRKRGTDEARLKYVQITANILFGIFNCSSGTVLGRLRRGTGHETV